MKYCRWFPVIFGIFKSNIHISESLYKIVKHGAISIDSILHYINLYIFSSIT